jgi:NADPH:quinone reductase-like Zn-dependent oxidoreductase
VKAIRFHEHGGPEVLRYEEAPDPQPRAGQVLVRVAACALNHLDLWQRRGLDRVQLPMPHISGADVSGTIAALGEHVGGLTVGQRVMLQPGLSCGRCARCLAGQDFLWGISPTAVMPSRSWCRQPTSSQSLNTSTLCRPLRFH